MAKGKKQEFVVTEDEIVSPEIERQAEEEIKKEREQTVDEDINENVKKLMEKAKEEGGSVIVKLKKPNDVKGLNIGKYKANEFDEDLIAKQYGGGTYFYVLRDEHGRIRAKWEEEYAEPLKKDVGQNPQGDVVTQIATLMKDTMKEIANIKTEINKPKDDKQDIILEVMKQNQQQQADLLKVLVTIKSNDNQAKQPTLTEMMTMFTGMFAIVNKMNNNQVQQVQPQNSMKDVVELATLFADLKENSSAEPQTFIDTIKTFLTDGTLANVIAMLKQPKQSMIKAPQPTQEQPKQIEQPTQEQQDKNVVCNFFKQYEKELFQMKVDGGSAKDISNLILNAISLNNEFKAIAYRFFKNTDTAFESIYENSVEFKNETEFLKQVVTEIHNYFFQPTEETTDDETEEQTQEEKLPQGEIIDEK